MDIVKKSLPEGFIHPCPYVGELKASNVSFEAVPEMVSFLNGRYRIHARLFDRKDENLVTGLVEFDLT
jgi:hypothetical protein